MRAAFIRGLIRATQKDPRIMLITGDLGYRFLEPFSEQFPDRFLNIGVAEANLVTVAAGLSTTGFIPFIYSIATFMSMRAYEQIRTDIVMQKLNVKVVGIGAGLAYTKAGPTHHSMEDIALMRMLPDMTIIAPIDQNETEAATEVIAQHNGCCYLRLEHNPEASLETKSVFQIGMGYVVKKTLAPIAILVTGTKISLARKVSEEIPASIYAFPAISPLDTVLLDKIVKKYPTIITLEEHRISGGFGSSVGEYILKKNYKNRLIIFGLKNEFTTISAEYNVLMKYNGLTPEQIIKTVRSIS